LPVPEIDAIVRIGKALSDRTRVRILAALAVRELCVCEITSLVELGQPAVSRHLGILRNAGLVEDVRDGRWVNYRLRTPPATSLGRRVLEEFRHSLGQDPDLVQIREGALVVDRLEIRGAVP
jgi:DNA-binding transcriptional ArsR family regulator